MMLAGRAGMPMATSTGNDMRLPPPASALTVPAANAVTHAAARSKILKVNLQFELSHSSWDWDHNLAVTFEESL